MVPRPARRPRCAVYTRKSSEEGLEQAFNSLDAQREACEAYIKSQAQEGWRLVRSRYDDGGVSGGTLNRPALKRLLADIGARKVDIVVVYKVDRLTRSLSDFAKIVDILDANGASFVSVTQQFNTTTSMGRLTLNMLLSFAQFEREIAGERIRDKIVASKKKGMWMGGFPPLGYDIKERKLVINEAEAKTVRQLFRNYVKLGSVRRLKEELDARGIVSKIRVSQSGRCWGGKPLARGALYLLLQNRIYLGEIVHKGASHPGEHEAIIDATLWEDVQARLSANRRTRATGLAAKSPSLLAGLLFDNEGHHMTPSHAVKNGRRYRYYVSRPLITESRGDAADGRRIPAGEIEELVVDRVREFLSDEVSVYDAIGDHERAPAEQRRLLDRAVKLGQTWSERSPLQRHSIIRALVDRIEVRADTVDIHLVPAAVSQVVQNDPHELTPASESAEDNKRIILSVPGRVERTGRDVRMIIAASDKYARKARPDSTLIKVISKAHEFHRKLVADGMTIGEIAASEGVHHSYISRLIRLAFLSPGIIEAVLNGRQPQDLSASRLLKRSRLPLHWPAQEKALGFR